MLMNDKIIFDRYYCINSAGMKEIRLRTFLTPCNHYQIPSVACLHSLEGILMLYDVMFQCTHISRVGSTAHLR